MSNQNFILLIVGPTGSGKSYSAMELARDMDPGFTVDRVVFNPEDFIRVTKQGLAPGSVIMWDEVGVGLSSREWYSIQNKMIAYVLETFRRDRLILIMTTPNIVFIDKKVRALIHGFAETIDKTFTGGKFGYVKYFHIITNLREGKMMYRYPRIRDKHGRTRVIRGKSATSGNMRFSMPPEWLWEPYEEIKLDFTEDLKDQALEVLSDTSTSSGTNIYDEDTTTLEITRSRDVNYTITSTLQLTNTYANLGDFVTSIDFEGMEQYLAYKYLNRLKLEIDNVIEPIAITPTEIKNPKLGSIVYEVVNNSKLLFKSKICF